MTKAELIRWVADHYYSEWELEQAVDLARLEGIRVARAWLVKCCGPRGGAGPGQPSYFTRSGQRVECYFDGSDFVTGAADAVVGKRELAKMVLDDPLQPRLF